MRIPRIMITAVSSGSGKTVISCSLMEALKQQGLCVVSGKCGPDYIDPMFHKEVLGIDAQNLDLFFHEERELETIFVNHAKEADIAVIEGVMGYYDGMGIDTVKASSYEVAKALKTPVILVLPCKGAAISAAALVKGILEFREENYICGILLNRISEILYPKMKEMLEKELGMSGHDIKVLGYIPEHPAFHLESRHLGLVTPKEVEGLRSRLSEAGRILGETVNLEELIKLAESAPGLQEGSDVDPAYYEVNEQKIRIAAARDEAFCFYYKENLELLKRLGCEIVLFSPIHDKELPKGSQGLILGGGYPELYAESLSKNRTMLESIRAAIESGMPCHAECGGFLYLHETLKDREGKEYPMAKVISGDAFPTERLVRFGYVCLTAEEDGLFLKKGETIRGHEFHYWDSTNNGKDVEARKPDGRRFWKCIHMENNLFAGFPHLAYGSNPLFVRRFVEKAKRNS